jgi:UDP-3-O-[3-hydroxymyristoyl] glucosamine N-acyltransferase
VNVPFFLPGLLTDLGVEYEVVGSPEDGNFTRIAPVSDADSSCLVFLDKPGDRALAQIRETPANLVLLRQSWAKENARELGSTGKCFFLVAQPRLVAGLLLGRMHPEEDSFERGIHSSAIVAPLQRRGVLRHR